MFTINDMPIELKRYPDGTQRLSADPGGDEAVLAWFYEQDEEMTLFFLARHLRENFGLRKLRLYLPYIPHARMDRVKKRQEVFTLKYFCEFVNSLQFDEVIVRDAHSSVALALLNKVVEEPIAANIKKLIADLLEARKDIVFYPDEGGCKRYSGMFDFPCAFGLKKRDWETGGILELEVRGELPARPFNVLIIDDIASFGGTFFNSAKKLKELGADRIYLYVTHCENSIMEGQLAGSGLIEKIYTTKSIFTGKHPLIEVI